MEKIWAISQGIIAFCAIIGCLGGWLVVIFIFAFGYSDMVAAQVRRFLLDFLNGKK